MLKPPLLFLFTIATSFVYGQQLGIGTGLSIDLNNNGKFKQVPLSVQWIPHSNRPIAFLAKLDGALPLGYTRQVEVYTLQAGLSPSSTIEQTIKNPWIALSVGGRVRLDLDKGQRYFFADVLPLGIGKQWFRITNKDYDNRNYEILNPDTELDKTGYFMGWGAGFVVKNFVTQIHLYTPLFASRGDYKLSYKLNAPLFLTIGYLLSLNTK